MRMCPGRATSSSAAAAVAAVAAVGLLLFDGHYVEGSSRSVESAYDTNKGVFSPQGRLVQLDYVEGIVKRGNLCMGVECKDGVVLMTDKLVTADAAKLLVDGGIRRIYRADSHIGILPAGLPADGRALAHKAMEYCRSHRREYGEPIPGRLLAERLGEFLHAACVRWGSRAYPNSLLIACWEEGGSGTPAACCLPLIDKGEEDSAAAAGSARAARVESRDVVQDEEEEDEGVGVADRDAGFQLYVVDPSGASRRHRAACVGRGSSRARKWLHRRAAAASADRRGGDAATQEEGGGREEEEEEGASKRSASGGGTAGQKKSSGSLVGKSLSPVVDREEEKEEEYSSETEEEDDGEEVEEGGDEGDDDGGDGAGDRPVSTATRSTRANRKDEHRQGRGRRERGGRRRGRRGRKRRWRLPLSQMTCAEAARSLVKEAGRVRAGEPGKAGAGGGRGAGDVASLAEVAWLSIGRKEMMGSDGEGGGKKGEPVFVHHRSMTDLFGGEQ